MTRLRMALWRLRRLFQRDGLDDQFSDEVQSHIDMLAADNVRDGISPKDARQAAMRAFGGVEQVKEAHRDARAFPWIEQTWSDIRHSIRSLVKNPAFTLFAALTLAVGVGVNTTVFDFYNAIALKAIAVADPDHVVRFKRWFESHRLGPGQHYFSYSEYAYVRDHSDDLFSDVIAASRPVGPLATLPPSAVQLSARSGRLVGQLVSANFFTRLGVKPALGRGFLPDEDGSPGGNPVLVLNDGFWKRIFNANPNVVGQVISLNDVSFTIVGVAPPTFTGTGVMEAAPDFWAPLSMQPQIDPGKIWRDEPTEQNFQLLVRLRSGTSMSQAQASVDGLIRQFDATFRSKDPTRYVRAQPVIFLADADDPRFKAAVAAFMLLVGLILVVACANIANMLLARCATRQREIGVRMALGSGRSRIIRQLLVESLLIAAAGGIVGFLFAVWSSHLLQVFFQEVTTPFGGIAGGQINFAVDWRVFTYAFIVALATGFVFGLSPALQYSNPNLTAAFKEESSPLGLGGKRTKLRGTLVKLQVAVSMFLLISSGLLIRGLLRSQAIKPDIQTNDVFLLQGEFAWQQDAARVEQGTNRIAEILSTIPEIKNVALGGIPWGGTWTPPIVVSHGNSANPERDRTLASPASETYFDVLGIPLLRGRNFTQQEGQDGAPLAIISEATARKYWPGEDAIGKHLQLDMDWRGSMADFEVVGIVKDVRLASLSRVDPTHVYLTLKGKRNAPYAILFKSRDGTRVLPAIQSAVAFENKDLARYLMMQNIEFFAARELFISQVFAWIAGILAILALVLAGSGIYGVMSYLVTQRTKEIGVRMSLGATSRNVIQDVIVQGMLPVLWGMLAGIVLAGIASLIFRATLQFPGSLDFLYGVPFYDPVSFIGLSVFVLFIAALASLIPAIRALRVDPMVALRHE